MEDRSTCGYLAWWVRGNLHIQGQSAYEIQYQEATPGEGLFLHILIFGAPGQHSGNLATMLKRILN